MRRRYDEILARRADIVAVGTGDAFYAKAFISDERIPFLVLVDDDAEAANAVGVVDDMRRLMGLRTMSGAARAMRHGHRQRRNGKRTTQMGATFVIGPGSEVHYAHIDQGPSEHAPLEQVLATLP